MHINYQIFGAERETAILQFVVINVWVTIIIQYRMQVGNLNCQFQRKAKSLGLIIFICHFVYFRTIWNEIRSEKLLISPRSKKVNITNSKNTTIFFHLCVILLVVNVF